ncbi:MAG: helix-turn-helix transcriptional regulator [Phycisphaeraceae bacterium]|nr:helix-turn-helix transcriptional regulator [Phycisphaeraceae bacterium]
MNKTTYPRLEMGGTRYVCVPEDIYNKQTAVYRKVSQETERRIAEFKAGKAETVPLSEINRTMISDDLKALRKEAGLSQAKLAELAGVRLETISRIEGGKNAARRDTLDKLMKVIEGRLGVGK